MTRLVTWWKSDIPYHTFMYTNFIVGFAFTPFAIYSNYQLQVTGFAIGTDIDGQVCSTYCVVPWGSGRIDLNAAILYMNALTFALGGVVTILIIAYADFWRYKTWLISIMIAVYGAVTVPSYWLRISTLRAFNSLFALSVLFGIISSVLIALLNIYIPHCMRTATPGNIDEEISPDSKTNVSLNNHSSKAVTEKAKAERAYGFTMSIFAMLTNNIAGILILVVTIILSTTLPLTSQQSAGLLVSTIVGCITLAGALPSWLGLPQLPTKPYPATHKWYTALLQILTPFRALLANPNMLLLLLAYTVYTDTTFATASIIGQLYYSELTPNTLEYSLYSLATYIFFVICTTAFYAAHRRWKFTLEKCFVAGYAIILLVPIWGIIGIARQDAFGYKVSRTLSSSSSFPPFNPNP
ncbi:hypothetical protein EJ05DRAFT_496194 [Pseudovirgaria hyperparasitica]|uniref:Autophagy-related protein n=1 Tax=Pseudovirgaria hyperparasitica TaxID=470096 RepID=A0A6A6WMB5_9PEZI|nr:uncharacterized protein EJ05DRAFT_496194 [Pseudovirgaria hyperparasitica]KAF2763360.1 hypothetical protein EJ05DRAFT_496194 [Pseudovirgaria hyperparasitica]